jgi:hypothetical protein
MERIFNSAAEYGFFLLFSFPHFLCLFNCFTFSVTTIRDFLTFYLAVFFLSSVISVGTQLSGLHEYNKWAERECQWIVVR